MRIVMQDMRHEGFLTDLPDIKVEHFTCPSSEAVNRHGVVVIEIERESSSKLPPRTLDLQPHARPLLNHRPGRVRQRGELPRRWAGCTELFVPTARFGREFPNHVSGSCTARGSQDGGRRWAEKPVTPSWSYSAVSHLALRGLRTARATPPRVNPSASPSRAPSRSPRIGAAEITPTRGTSSIAIDAVAGGSLLVAANQPK
jgi:hypothetical protein